MQQQQNPVRQPDTQSDVLNQFMIETWSSIRNLETQIGQLDTLMANCAQGNIESMNALCDLGASINLMPLSVFRRLKLGEARPTTVTLQLADCSLVHPRGIIEDVLVKVDKFIFPAYFIVLDMVEDTNVPLILGRPFLAIGQALIDVQKY
ncbi:uncharacterized protein LOC133832190 [Humulus lupulus]|uniref:uncharacterized protein LOC133832190 n=1 Tax=Humulus lupulus TaxID=3486 RepID=UPI002B406464|nr:uncharacterized protein LOC133832190 [Humulus lupulus]